MCMQLTYRYLATNKSVLIADLTNNITEYRPVYARNMTVYRGIDNVLTFEIKNPDQKPVSILNTYKPYFVMFDENNTQITYGICEAHQITQESHTAKRIYDNNIQII